jgi:hypothetical protein
MFHLFPASPTIVFNLVSLTNVQTGTIARQLWYKSPLRGLVARAKQPIDKITRIVQFKEFDYAMGAQQ